MHIRWRLGGDRGAGVELTIYSLEAQGRSQFQYGPEILEDDNRHWPYHPIPPRNVYETLDVRGGFPISTQIPHRDHRSFRMGNHHRDDVSVFRFEVFDYHVDVHDVRVEVPVNELTGRFVAPAEVSSKHEFQSVLFERGGGDSPEIETEGIYGELLS